MLTEKPRYVLQILHSLLFAQPGHFPDKNVHWKYSQITSATIIDDRKILRKFAEKESLVFPTTWEKIKPSSGFSKQKGRKQ